MSGEYDFLYPTLEELEKAEEAKLTGSLPKWMQGTLIRTGPGKFDFQDFTVNHFLDGYAMLTRFKVSNKETVKYDRKFLKTDAYTKAMTAGKPVIPEFGTKAQKSDPTKSLFSRLIPSLIPEISDNCNVSMFSIGNELFAAADTCFFRQVDPDSLECGEKFDTTKLFGLNLWSCHPMRDNDGFIYNIGTSFITGLKYNVLKIPIPVDGQSAKDCLKRAKILATVPSSHTFCSSPCHSFGKTENYIIFIEQPLVIVAQKVLAGLVHKSCNRDFMEYRPEMKNRFHIVEKKTGRNVLIKTDYTSADPFFFLHFINCYEEDNEIVVDLCAFPNANCVDLSLKDFKKGFEGKLEDLAEGRRYVIPLPSKERNWNEIPDGTNLIHSVQTSATAIKEKKVVLLSPETLTKRGIEVPIVHKDFSGRKYKFFFGGGPRGVGPYKSSICKFNVDTKESVCFRLGDGEFLGEPIFVPNPEGNEEDDGILVSCLTRAIQGEKCGIVFINAKTMAETARAEFCNFVPLAIHGTFIRDEDRLNNNI